MNTHALLTSQGWRGHGHTLHAHNDKIGILKPILIAHKKDNSGLGANKFTTDQWWLSAIDEQLKGLDTSGGKPVQTVKGGIIGRMDRRYARFALYECFVRGEVLGSTIEEEMKEIEERRKREEKKRKASSKAEKSKEKESKTERKARKEAKKARRAVKEAKRAAKVARRAARVQMKMVKEVKRAEKKARKEKKETRRANKMEKRKEKK